MISFKNISTKCFDDLSFDLPEGKVCKVLANSDYDVRVFIDTLLFLSEPLSGEVFLFDENMGSLSEDERLNIFKRIGMVWNRGGLVSNLKVRENVFLPLAYHKGERAENVEEKVEALFLKMGWESKDLPAYMGRLPGTLPLHEKKLVCLIRVMLSRPDLVIYESLFDGLNLRQAGDLLKTTSDFHNEEEMRTSIYVSSDEDALSRVSANVSLMQKGREFLIWD